MKKFKAIVCAAVSLCMIAVPLSSSIVFNAGAEDKPKTIQEKISELNEKSEEFQKILDQTETDIDEAEKYGDALLEKIKVINEKIVLMNQSISKLEEEAEKSNEEVDLQIDALCKRLRTIYMAGSASNLEIVLGAKSFDDFIDKMALVKNLSAYDNKLINEIDDKLEEIKEKKEEIQTQKDALQNELDVCWADYAGQDAAAILEQYKGGTPVVHLKDYKLEGHLNSAPYALIGISTDNTMKDEGGSFEYRPLGCGQMDMERIIRAAIDCGTQWLCVEQDEPSMGLSRLQGVAKSVEYLRGLDLM